MAEPIVEILNKEMSVKTMQFLTMNLRALAAAGVLVAATTTASAANYPKSVHPESHSKNQQWVLVSFRNASLQEREVGVGNERFKVPLNGQTTLRITNGATVRVYSDVNRKVNGTALMTVSPADERSTVAVN